MEKEKEIQFKALSSGLGFHPFSNGLPYSPPAKSPEKFQDKAPEKLPEKSSEKKQLEKNLAFSNGTSAYTAGRPSFVYPQKPLAVKSTVHAPAQPTSTKPLLHAQQRLGFEYLLKRVLAFSVDSFLNILLSSVILGFCLWSQSNNFDFMMNTGVLLISACFLIFFNWAMITSQEILFHTSIGKKLFGLRLQGSLGAILGRAVLFIPSAAFFGLGVIWAIFSPEKMSWYDAATGVQPKEIAEI